MRVISKKSLERGCSLFFVCSILPLFMCCGMPDRMGPPSPGPPAVQKTAAAKYDISLIAVERGSDPINVQDRQFIYNVAKDDAGSSFEDERVAITWKPGPVAFGLKITNKTGSGIKVVWDEARFIDRGSNTAQRMLHSGFGYDERNLSQPPALVPAGGVLNDFMHPADNFRIVENDEKGRGDRYNYWVRAPFLPDQLREGSEERKAKAEPGRPGDLAKTLRAQAEKFIGKTYSVILRLEINNTRLYYFSTFRIDGVRVTEAEVKRPPVPGQRERRGRPPGMRPSFSAADLHPH